MPQDGRYEGYMTGRGNGQNIDLNRNFPDLTSIAYSRRRNRFYRTDHIPIPDAYWFGKVGVSHGCTTTPYSPEKKYYLATDISYGLVHFFKKI